MRRRENIGFLILLLAVFLWGGIVFVKDETSTSILENRKLDTFQHFTLNDFISGDFQDGFENTLSDQFIGSEQIRAFYKQTLAHLPNFGIEENLCHNRYLELQTVNQEVKRGIYNCDDYIVYLPATLSDDTKGIINENIEKYNHLNSLASVYYYFVDDPSSFDFVQNKKVIDYYGELKSKMKGEKALEKLDWDSFEEYKKYYYKNDHHWNYVGSYQGYLNIAKMLGIKEVVEPKGTYTNHEDFYGSYSRNTNNFDYHDEFIFYEFDLPEHDTLINHKPQKYNHYDEYKKHEYEYNEAENYYAYVYGDDYGEVVFDYNEPKKENLLIIGNSYSNPVNELIASNYNKTYVVDLRYYKESIGKDFVPKDYITENNIDKVLVIMSPTFIRLEEPNRGLEL
ncbi:hypothetical protein IIY24_03295 [Candidatus Saccharibacteria bacterium]|nr:hypothetical protein [Candidatus Saccharibacteria bacterium]